MDIFLLVGILNAPPQAKGSTPQPTYQTKHNAHPTTPVTNNNALFNAAESAPFFSSANATLDRCNSSPATTMVFRNSFDALSLTLEDKEDNIEALTISSSSPTTTGPSHM